MAALLAAVLALPASASATWSEPAIMSADGTSSVEPFAVGMDQDGDAIATWARNTVSGDQVQVRTMSAAGVRSPTRNVVLASMVQSLRIAVAPDGTAVLVWQNSIGGGRVQARQLSAAGVLGPTLTLSASGGSEPDAAIDAGGDAVIAWHRFDGTNLRIQARALSAAGALSATQNLSAGGANAIFPRVGIDNDGNALIAWQRTEGSVFRVQSVTRAADGTVAAPRNLSTVGQNSVDPRVGVAPTGRAVVAWATNDGANSRAQIRALDTAGTAPSPTQTLSAAGVNAEPVRVAIAPNGVATAVWLYAGSPERIQLRQRAADVPGTLSPTLTLANTGSPLDPDVAINGLGDAMVTWQASDGLYRVWAREYSSAGTLGPARVISPQGMNVFGPVDVARSPAPGGGAAVVWGASESAGFERLDLAVGP